MSGLDRLEAEALSPLFRPEPVVVDCAEADAERRAGAITEATQAVVIGLDAEGRLPGLDPEPFDVLLTAAHEPPAPWVGPSAGGVEALLARIVGRIAATPVATAVFRRMLRLGAALDFRGALELESLAYSTLLSGAEFHRWRAASPPGSPPLAVHGPAVLYARDEDGVTLTLDRPQTGNATTAELRDALSEALAAVLDDPTDPPVTLRGAGRSFSVGGHLGEFGAAHDLARAHLIRTLRSPAARLHELGDRARVLLHGACIGGGLEIAAAAGRRVAHADAVFQLPELAMGLIPGAGGTASLPRVIGRHRTAALGLSGMRLGAGAALAWGLVDEVVPKTGRRPR
jgi:enoyl-CoA hydratase/carnithine racemase